VQHLLSEADTREGEERAAWRRYEHLLRAVDEIPTSKKYNLRGAPMSTAPAYVSLSDPRKLPMLPIMVRFELFEEKKGYSAANSVWAKSLEHIKYI